MEDYIEDSFEIVVDKGQVPLRIDKFLMGKLANVSRTKIQTATKTDFIFVNEKPIKPNYKVKPGDVIIIRIQKSEHEFELLAEDIPLNILYEDHDLIIVNKEASMVVHPGHNNWTGTLVNALTYRFQNLPTSVNGKAKPGLIHRIDKETSGLLVIAKSEKAMTHLAKQFFDHSIERTYHSIVWGEVKNDKGSIEGNIGRSYSDRRMRSVFEDGNYGKHAVTHYKVLKRYRYITLVECKLETGRTHQIRVHMKYIAHTIFNDKMYGGDRILKGERFSKYKAFVENCFKVMPRQGLHAKSLGFVHPTTKKKIFFDSEYPEDFKNVLDKWEHYVQYH